MEEFNVNLMNMFHTIISIAERTEMLLCVLGRNYPLMVLEDACIQ
jgi:hypothetical protein